MPRMDDLLDQLGELDFSKWILANKDLQKSQEKRQHLFEFRVMPVWSYQSMHLLFSNV